MQHQKNYQVTITTDVIRGSHNLGGSYDYFFSNVKDIRDFLNKRVFAGRSVSFVAGLAISETLKDTLVASIYCDSKPLKAKDFI